jgi:GrpB-like predicted nucleotidyltransferase (UPF0157 family)
VADREGPLERHPSLDERFDPAVRIVDYDPAWPVRAADELRRLEQALGAVAARLEHVGSSSVISRSATSFAAMPMKRTATPR